MSEIIIRQAKSVADLDDIYRFRYRVYVQEQGRFQRFANHNAFAVCEPLDRTARLFGAWRDNELIGTVRSNFSRDGNIVEYDDLYQMNMVRCFHPRSTSISTKLIVSNDSRGHMIAIRLCKAAFLDGLSNGILFNFIDCDPNRPRIIDMFEALGYVKMGYIKHPEYGNAVKLMLCLSDATRFREKRSPFSAIAPIPHEPSAVSLFAELVRERDERRKPPAA